MTNYDVFNGDTDGIFARHQLRLALPLDTVNVSGVKRDVNLLRHVEAKEGDLVTVFSKENSVAVIAKNLDTIPYEILATLNRRIKRVYH